MATDSASQRYVKVYSVTADTPGQSIGALGTSVASINYGQPTMSGLLVRAWGNVTYVDSSGAFFYIDDGSGVIDSSGVAKGLRVMTGAMIPNLGEYAEFTGIASVSLVPAGSSTVVVPSLRIPAASILSIDSGDPYCGSTGVALTITAMDMDTASDVYEMRFSNDDSTWSSWSAYSTMAPWMLTSGDGTKTVYAQLADSAGNVLLTAWATIVLDTTPPTGSVSINSGAAYCNSTSVTLTLSAVDSASSVYQMRFSNDDSTWSFLDSLLHDQFMDACIGRWHENRLRPILGQRGEHIVRGVGHDSSRYDGSNRLGHARLRQVSPPAPLPLPCPTPAHPTPAAGSRMWHCGTFTRPLPEALEHGQTRV